MEGSRFSCRCREMNMTDVNVPSFHGKMYFMSPRIEID